jgi:hypothetical protein
MREGPSCQDGGAKNGRVNTSAVKLSAGQLQKQKDQPSMQLQGQNHECIVVLLALFTRCKLLQQIPRLAQSMLGRCSDIS